MRGRSFSHLRFSHPLPKAWRRRRGSTLVEFALGGATFCALLIAAFALNYGVFVKATLRHAAQEGARFATTGRVIDQMNHADSVRAVVRRNSFGLLGGDAGALQIRVEYVAADGRSSTRPDRAAVVEVTVSHVLEGVGAGQRVEVKALETMLGGGHPR